MPKVKTTSNVKSTSKKEVGPLEDFHGFKVLPVIVKDGTRHFMYMAQHEVRSESDTLPADRTLFLVNLPIDTTDSHLQYLFRSHGTIASIVYHGVVGGSTQQHLLPTSEDAATYNSNTLGSTYTSALTKPKEDKKSKYLKPNSKKRKQQDTTDNDQDAADNLDRDRLRRILHSGASAHVVFSQVDALNSILSMTRIVRKWMVDEEDNTRTLQPLGFQRHMLAFELSRPDHGELQQQVDSYMMKFKENEYQKERDLLERMNKMDEDGFVVVSRHNKKRNTDGEIQVTATSSASAGAYDPTKAKKKTELVDFYRFQLREKKQNELLELRKRFEDDKIKIDRLKQSRKFRPF